MKLPFLQQAKTVQIHITKTYKKQLKRLTKRNFQDIFFKVVSIDH